MRAKKTSVVKERLVTFEVMTRLPLPVGQQVFVSGNLDMLGNWAPDGFPLTRMDDNLWSGHAFLPAHEPVAFKITRGTWASEEVSPDGEALPENIFIPAGSNTTFRRTVFGWKDQIRA
ncbi:MAG TPA: carbohydrate-binding module family 20 domain-containing protein [Kiritimatiellia bacterium]|nr:carbohydrate-binding module family 20 domain-containing protein [Kiritimatiellia bacterium]